MAKSIRKISTATFSVRRVNTIHVCPAMYGGTIRTATAHKSATWMYTDSKSMRASKRSCCSHQCSKHTWCVRWRKIEVWWNLCVLGSSKTIRFFLSKKKKKHKKLNENCIYCAICVIFVFSVFYWNRRQNEESFEMKWSKTLLRSVAVSQLNAFTLLTFGLCLRWMGDKCTQRIETDFGFALHVYSTQLNNTLTKFDLHFIWINSSIGWITHILWKSNKTATPIRWCEAVGRPNRICERKI